MSSSLKSLEERIRESIDIRTQLNKQGIMEKKVNKDIFKTNARQFIREGKSTSFDIKCGSYVFTICLRVQNQKQSGVHVHVLD